MELYLLLLILLGICINIWSLHVLHDAFVSLVEFSITREKDEILDDQKNNINKGW